MISDMKPEHWPKMLNGSDAPGEQSAVRVLAEIRHMIVSYRKRSTVADECWRSHHAETAPLVDVVGGLIADADVIDMMYKQVDKEVTPLKERIKKLQDDLEESKRPFTAQMLMQNRRIIALTEELDKLRLGINP